MIDKKKLFIFSFFAFLIFIFGFVVGFLVTIVEPKYMERLSPSDVLNYTDIELYDNMACIMMANLTMATIVDTNSMDPTLDKEATILRYKPKNISYIHIGDIISFDFDNEIIIHRVIEIKENKLLTKGDNNKWNDGWIDFKEVKGKLLAIIY